MRAVDTNVVVRLLTRDDPRQTARAEAFVSKGAWVSHIVQNPARRVAFVSYDRAGAVSGSEHWFDHDEDALAWLVSDGRMEEDH